MPYSVLSMLCHNLLILGSADLCFSLPCSRQINKQQLFLTLPRTSIQDRALRRWSGIWESTWLEMSEAYATRRESKMEDSQFKTRWWKWRCFFGNSGCIWLEEGNGISRTQYCLRLLISRGGRKRQGKVIHVVGEEACSGFLQQVSSFLYAEVGYR